MKQLSFALFLVAAVGVATPALAVTPIAARAVADKTVSPGEVPMTPEIWFYQQQMQQYQDPKMAVRRNAEFRADMRSRRLATMKWFGLSNQRPRANVDPIHQNYSAAWASNNEWYPDRWVGAYGH